MRKSIIALSVSLLVSPVSSWSFGLGQLELKSSINQPLKALIKLSSFKEKEIESLDIGLAQKSYFKKAGIPYKYFFNDFEYKVIKQDNSHYLSITSNKPIRETFLEFIIDARWEIGRMQKEFTVLLDPPEIVQDQMNYINNTSISSSINKSPVIASAANYSNKVKSRNSNVSHYTSHNDTLGAIAKRMAQPGVSINQMMMTLLNDNPEAFINNNINNLKAGYLLTIKNPASLTRLNKIEAKKEVRRQYQAWKNRNKVIQNYNSKTIKSIPKQSHNTSKNVEKSPEKSSPKLVILPEKTAQYYDNASILEIKKALVEIQGRLDGLSVENLNLRDRLIELESKMTVTTALIQLKNEKLSLLQDEKDKIIEEKISEKVNDAESDKTQIKQKNSAISEKSKVKIETKKIINKKEELDIISEIVEHSVYILIGLFLVILSFFVSKRNKSIPKEEKIEGSSQTLSALKEKFKKIFKKNNEADEDNSFLQSLEEDNDGLESREENNVVTESVQEVKNTENNIVENVDQTDSFDSFESYEEYEKNQSDKQDDNLSIELDPDDRLINNDFNNTLNKEQEKQVEPELSNEEKEREECFAYQEEMDAILIQKRDNDKLKSTSNEEQSLVTEQDTEVAADENLTDKERLQKEYEEYHEKESQSLKLEQQNISNLNEETTKEDPDNNLIEFKSEKIENEESDSFDFDEVEEIEEDDTPSFDFDEVEEVEEVEKDNTLSFDFDEVEETEETLSENDSLDFDSAEDSFDDEIIENDVHDGSDLDLSDLEDKNEKLSIKTSLSDKLEMSKVYIELEDKISALKILDEVINNGTTAQKTEALKYKEDIN